jgi:hypothetical protein
MARQGIEDDLVDVAVGSFKLARRQSWQGAALLGAGLFLLLAVALPLGIEWWVHEHASAMRGPGSARVGHVMERTVWLRFVFPLKVLGTCAAIGCWLVALWKIGVELRRAR